MNTTPDQPHHHDTNTTGPETWVREAIAQQEEHIKRTQSCLGQLGRAHHFVDFGHKSPDGTIAFAHTWRECLTCVVTQTDADYQRRLNATKTH